MSEHNTQTAIHAEGVHMETIISVDPSKCRLWSLHDRFESEINEASCKEEIESFRTYGQLLPALGRRILDDPKIEVELICGARRLFAARHLKMTLRVELREFTD